MYLKKSGRWGYTFDCLKIQKPLLFSLTFVLPCLNCFIGQFWWVSNYFQNNFLSKRFWMISYQKWISLKMFHLYTIFLQQKQFFSIYTINMFSNEKSAVTRYLQAFQWIFCVREINCPCKNVFSKIEWAIYCPSSDFWVGCIIFVILSLYFL